MQTRRKRRNKMDQVIFNSAASRIVLSLLAFEIRHMDPEKWETGNFESAFDLDPDRDPDFLYIFRIDYESYNSSAEIYQLFSDSPATVSLAIPLYQQIRLLKKNLAAILVGILSGVLTSLFSILAMYVFRMNAQYVTLLRSRSTTAIGMECGGRNWAAM